LSRRKAQVSEGRGYKSELAANLTSRVDGKTTPRGVKKIWGLRRETCWQEGGGAGGGGGGVRGGQSVFLAALHPVNFTPKVWDGRLLKTGRNCGHLFTNGIVMNQKRAN